MKRKILEKINYGIIDDTVYSILIGRQPCTGSRRKPLNEQQEQEIRNMVMTNNAITLRQIRAAILQDNAMF